MSETAAGQAWATARRVLAACRDLLTRLGASPRTRGAPTGARTAQAGDPPSAAGAEPALDDRLEDCSVYTKGRHQDGPLTVRHASRLARDGDSFVWVDLHEPSRRDIASVAAAFDLPALAVEDAVHAHQRPKLDVYDSTIFFVLKPVTYIDRDEVVEVSEIGLFIGPGFVVTVRHGTDDLLERVRRAIDADPDLVPGPMGVLYRATDLAVDGFEAALTSIDIDVDEIELQVFADADDDGNVDDNSQRIYMLKREIAEFRRAVVPLGGALERLAERRAPNVDAAAAPFFRDVYDHALRAAEAIDSHDRLLTDVLQADLARVAARQSAIALRQNEIAVQQNQDMRKISAWAAIALVPTAIAGIYGMNFDHMPELRWQYGYFIVLAVIALVCTGLHRLFRRNGWL